MATIPYMYALVQTYDDDGGDSAPSPVAQINAPDTLSATTYIVVTMATVPGVTYKLLRQRSGIDAFITRVETFTAVADSTTIHDTGLAPCEYLVQRGNQYQLKELVKIRRVYMLNPQGEQQPLVPTTIQTMDGSTRESWDQTSGTVLGQPAFTPQWLAQKPATFPVRSPYSSRVPVTTPWQNSGYGSQAPEYYLRGGYLGVMPPPLQVYRIILDYLPKPPDFRTDSDESIYPDGFLDAICFKMLEYMSISDDDTREDSFRGRYDTEVRKLRITYVDTIQGDRPHQLVPLTIRTQIREWPT